MKKIFKQASLLICSFVMAICAAFAIVNIPTAQAETNSTGLTEKTLTQINPTLGVTATGVEVDSVEFDGYANGAFHLIEFSGKNEPNFAFFAE